MKEVMAIDIGNTNIAVGIFIGSRLIKKFKISTNKPFKLRGINPKKIRGVVISSVVPGVLSRVVAYLRKTIKSKILVLGRDAEVPIRNMYRNKSEVGQDRLVNSFAAMDLYGAPAVIVDFGTAITFDIVSRRGEYLGGLILPGVEISLSSLYEKTALLPKVALKSARYIIGKDTVNSMRGGILFGFGAMCDGLVLRYRKILGKSTKVIATGGNSGLIKRYARSIQIVDPDLTLKGLYLISKKIL